MTSVLRPSLQDQLNKQRAAEMRLEAERRRLREALEAAEARATRVELGRRSLEGEMQRLKLSLGDRESESQTSQERHDSLLKQVQQAEILCKDISITKTIFSNLRRYFLKCFCQLSGNNWRKYGLVTF